MMRTDILYTVNKLAKITKRPGKKHFDALNHVLQYLRDNMFLGIRFYHNILVAPITKMLTSEKLLQNHPFLDAPIHLGTMTWTPVKAQDVS
jgi:hypothetical protein